MMSDVQFGITEICNSKRRNDVPHAEEADDRVLLDDRVAARAADAMGLDAMAKIERRRGAATEPDDIDDAIAVSPSPAQVIVRLVDARQLSEAEHTAGNLAQK